MLALYRTPGIAKLGEGCLDEINTFIVIDGFALFGELLEFGSPLW